jgi:membrane dipeptidase
VAIVDLDAGTRPRVIDGLNCAVVTRDQFERTLKGGVSIINLTAITPWSSLPDSLRELETNLATIEAMDDIACIIRSVEDIHAAQRAGKLGVIIGSQSSQMAEADLAMLATFKRLGMRILQPTYNERCKFGVGAPFVGADDEGMTGAGHAWIAEMHRLHLLIDLSHCSHKTSADYLAASRQPVVFSHANSYELCRSPRNKTDDHVRAVARTGGLIGAVMWAPSLKHATRPSIEDYLDHLDHLVKVGGIEHVAFASDQAEGHPGGREEWETTFGPRGRYPNITGILGPWYEWDTRLCSDYSSLAHTPRIWDAMKKRGYSGTDIEKVMSKNWLRVLRDVWG